MKIFTYHISDNIDIKGVKKSIQGKIISETNAEIFIELSTGEYMSAYEYGSIAFTNVNKEKVSTLINSIKSACTGTHSITEGLSEDIEVEFKGDGDIKYDNNTLTLPERMSNNNKVVRIIMFDLSQTVALEYYDNIGDTILVDIKKLSKELETKGKLSISKSQIMKFIGKILSVKNNIVDTLYIFDSPEMTWSDEDASKIHTFLTGVFDIKSRFREVENLTKVIEDNLDVYKEIYHHKESSTLEIIVVVLIVIEILQSFMH